MNLPEGIVQYRVVHRHRALDETRWSDRLPQLLIWRDRLRGLGLIGQDPARYDGYGFGNLSCRADSLVRSPGRRSFLISAVQTSGLEQVTSEHFACVEAYDPERNAVVSHGLHEPSSESLSHAAVYDSSPSIGAVIHVHAPSLWAQRETLNLPTTDEEAQAGTVDMAEAISELWNSVAMGDVGVVAMGGHPDGLLAFGRDLREAGERLLTVWHQASDAV